MMVMVLLVIVMVLIAVASGAAGAESVQVLLEAAPSGCGETNAAVEQLF